MRTISAGKSVDCRIFFQWLCWTMENSGAPCLRPPDRIWLTTPSSIAVLLLQEVVKHQTLEYVEMKARWSQRSHRELPLILSVLDAATFFRASTWHCGELMWQSLVQLNILGPTGFVWELGTLKSIAPNQHARQSNVYFWGIPWYTMVYHGIAHFHPFSDTPWHTQQQISHMGEIKTHLCHTASEEPICPSVGRRALGANDRVVMVPLVPRRVKSREEGRGNELPHVSMQQTRWYTVIDVDGPNIKT